MKQLFIKPEINYFDDAGSFLAENPFLDSDLVITNKYIWEPAFGSFGFTPQLIFQESFGMGEPSDEMAEAMFKSISRPYERVIAIGGGTVIDISKLFVLKKYTPVTELFTRVFPAEKERELVVIPTTCGTGSEVTNISILAINSLGSKLGLADNALFPDKVFLIPSLLASLPFKVFATSSIDALIHAMESFLSPKASEYSRIFSGAAIDKIIRGYKRIASEGRDTLPLLLSDFLIASNYAGIAFGNAGCAAVHAMSYPLSGKYHVPHGEANYCLLTGVFKKYMSIKKDGAISELNTLLSSLLDCGKDEVYEKLEKLLESVIKLKSLREYGVTEADLNAFTDTVTTSQGRLMANCFVPLSADNILSIYKELL